MNSAERIQIIQNSDGSTDIIADDDVSARELADFLSLEYPSLAAQLRRAREMVHDRGGSEMLHPFWR